MPFVPEFEGAIKADNVPEDLTERIEARVRDGLFLPGSRRRANYVVHWRTRDEVRFSAADALTAFNIGLNDVVLRRESSTRITYRVTYWRWTRYAGLLCGGIGLALLCGLLFVLPWISPQQRKTLTSPLFVALFGGNVAFWGFLWPWILAALHKKPAARCLERILQEELPGRKT